MKYLSCLANSKNNHIGFIPLDIARLHDHHGEILATILRSD